MRLNLASPTVSSTHQVMSLDGHCLATDHRGFFMRLNREAN